MGELTGNDVVLSLGGSPLEKLTEWSFQIGNEIVDVSNIDSNLWREIIDGDKDLSINLSGNIDESDTNGALSVLDELLGDNEIPYSIDWANAGSGERSSIAGTALVESGEFTADKNSPYQASCSLQNSGTPTFTNAV